MLEINDLVNKAIVGDCLSILREMPEPLIEFLIRKSSVEGEIILDPFCGSGTTAAVAARLGRRFITMDLDSSFVETANKRIEEAKQLAEVKL